MRARARLILSVSALIAVLVAVVLPLSLGGNQRQSRFSATQLAVQRDDPLLVIPKPVPSVPVAALPSVYTVQPGDTLSSVAARFATSVAALAGWNDVADPNVIAVGLVLRLPPASYVPPAPPRPVPAVRVPVRVVVGRPVVPAAPPVVAGSCAAADHGTGVYDTAALESLWVSCGGPLWAAAHAAGIAQCESGGRSWAYNRSGAAGLWQIKGEVVPGDVFDPAVNAENAVAKFHASRDTFAQWVCG